MTRLGQNLNIDMGRALRRGCVDLPCQLLLSRGFGAVLGQAKAAIEVEEVDALRQGFAPFALEVLANLVFEGIEHAVRMPASQGQGESFLHG